MCLFIAGLLKIKKQPIGRILIAMAVLIVGGIVLAELFKVFSWNGIFQALDRTIAAGSDPYKLTTGRPKLFGWVIASLNKENAWLLGLGSQGYCFMPNRTFAFQPHNLVFQFLAEWGIVGTVIFLSVLIYGFFDGARRYLFSKSTPLTIAVQHWASCCRWVFTVWWTAFFITPNHPSTWRSHLRSGLRAKMKRAGRAEYPYSAVEDD